MKINLKKTLIIVFSLIMTHGLCLLIAGKYVFLKNDISLVQPIKPEFKTKNWIITFGKGDVYEAGQNFIAQSSINKGFEVIINYKRRDIDPIFYEQHKEILNQKRGAGYWLWKPYFILKTLDIMQEGDVLVYCDAGVTLLHDIFPYINKMIKNDKDIILFHSGHTNRIYNKKDTFIFMNTDEKYRDYPQTISGLIMMRNTQTTRNFIKKWLLACQDKRILTDQKSINEEFPDFKDHRHDQAILSLLYYKEPDRIIMQEYQEDVLIHQRRDINISLAWLVLKRKFHNKLSHFWKGVIKS